MKEMATGILIEKTEHELQLGRMLKVLRDGDGLTQRDVAELFELKSESQISDWENGLVIPHPDQLDKYAKKFKRADGLMLYDARALALRARKTRRTQGQTAEKPPPVVHASKPNNVAHQSAEGPAAATESRDVHEVTQADDVEREPVADGMASDRRSRRRQVGVGVGALLVLIAIAAGAFVLGSLLSHGGTSHHLVWRAPASAGPGMTLTVDSRSAIGANERADIGHPLQLVTGPYATCGDCLIPETIRHTGQTYRHVVCQTNSDWETNGNLQSPGIRRNPGLASGTRWYGVKQPNGTLGFVNEVWISAAQRSTVNLPACPTP